MISLKEIREHIKKEQEELIKKHGEPKVEKLVYCKYCYKNVKPMINYYEDLIQCSECNYGLAPLRDIIKAGSYEKWNEKITLDFDRMCVYLNGIREGSQKSTGKDEFGIVPYICPICKKRELTIHGPRGEFCSECDPDLCKKHKKMKLICGCK